MRIQHNIAALNSYRQLGGNNNAVAKNLEKLSSGYKINRAGDDAAGLAISEKMRAQITGLETAQKNAQDGISLVQTAEGALTEVHSMLNRMAELATQSSNGTYDDSIDRANLQAEVDSLRDEINRISESTNFNGINLLDGSLGGPKTTNKPGDVMDTAAIIGGVATAATAATGNKFTIETTDLKNAAGTGDAYVTISYKDENGEAKTASVKFTMDTTDAKKSAQSLNDAINNHKDLKNLFEAKFDDATDKLSIEGKQTGENAKSQITSIKASKEPSSALKTNKSVAGSNAVYNLSELTDNAGTITVDGTTYKYDKTNGAPAKGSFKNLNELNTLLANHGIKFESASNPADFDTALTDVVIKDTTTGLDADLGALDISIEVDKDGDGTVDSKLDTPATEGVASSFVLGEIKNLGAGIEREFTLNFKKLDTAGTAVADETLKFKVTGGTTAEETRENIEKALQEEIEKNAEFKRAYGEVDVVVDKESGEISITAQSTGTKHADLDIASIKVVGDNKAAGKTFIGKGSAGLDSHLNLKDAFDKNGVNDFKENDTVTIGKDTYTFKANADGKDGKTFSDLDSLKAAAKQNGIALIDMSKDKDGSALIAKSAAKFTFDFDGRIGADVLGATIDFGGTKFKFVELGQPATTEEGTVNIAIAKNANAEEIAEALAKGMKAVTKADEKDEESKDVTWTGATAENKAGKKTIVELTADVMGKIDMPKPKFKEFGINLQVGDTNDDFQKVRVSVDSMDAAALGIDKVDITDQNKAAESIKMVKDAINTVSSQRGKLGAVQNRLEHTINNLGVTTENITAAESRIRDTDMAKEMMAYTKNNILVQSAQAMLAQANTLPQGVLQLLG